MTDRLGQKCVQRFGSLADHMDSFTAKSVSSTLHGATVQKAEGNEFINTGRDTIKIIHVIQNFIGAPESEQASGGNIVEDNEDLKRVSVAPESEQTSGRNIVEDNQDLQPVSDPIGNFDIYSAISTVLATIFGRRRIQFPLVVGDPTYPDESNLLPQEAITDRALIHCLEPAATVSDILAPDDFPFSSLPNTDTARYTRSMLNCQRTAGYPLYEPRPDCDPSTEYWKKGVRIGDVGIVTEDGIFDFIFNVCPSQNPFINPSELPDDFEALEHPEIRVMEQHFKMETHLFNNAVNRIEEPDARYKCSGSEGAILELPSGATLFEARNKRSFKALASRHAEDWYKYTIVTRGRDVPNGSLYLATSCVKCTDWGIAVFDRPSASQDYLQFIEHEFQTTNRNMHSKYNWKGSGSFAAKVAMDSDSRDDDGSNQCIFMRGYKIMLRKDVWDNAIDPHSTVTRYITTPSSPNPGSKQTRQGDFSNQNDHLHREDGGGSESAGGTSRRAAQNTYECAIKAVDVGTLLTTPSQLGAERVIIQADFNASPLNPSDLVNAALLSQEPDAKVALTHDDDWWDLLRDYGDLGKIASSYTSVVDEYGSASLEIVDDALAFANKQGISSMQQQSLDQQHLQPPNHNLSADMFSSPTTRNDAVRRPSPSHPPMPSQHMQNGMMTSAAQQNNTHMQPVPQTSMPFSSRPLQEQAMYLRNMIQILNNNIAAHRASPQDVDPMTKARVSVTCMSKRDAAVKMLNNIMVQMQAQSGGGQGQMPWMQQRQRQQQQGPSQPSFDAVPVPKTSIPFSSRPLQEQAMHLRNMIQNLNNNIAAHRASLQEVDPMTKARVAVTYVSKRDAAVKMLNNVLVQMRAQSGGEQGQLPWMQQQQQKQQQQQMQSLLSARNSFPDTSQIRPPGASNPLPSASLQPRQQQPTPPYRFLDARDSLPLDTSQIRPPGASNLPLPSASLQPRQQQPTPPYRFLDARDSLPLDTSQIRPPGAPLPSASLQPRQQQPTPPYRFLNARDSLPLDTSQIRPPGASNLPLPSASLQPRQQQPTPPYRFLDARDFLPLDTSQIRPPGESNPLLPSASLQPPHQHPTPTPSPVPTSGHTPGFANAPSSSTPLNTNTPTPALPPSSLSPPSLRSPKGTPKRRPSRAAPPPLPAESPAATAASSSIPNAKRPREEDDTVVDADSIGNNASVANEPSPPKRVKTDWEIPESEELKKKAEIKIESVEDTNAFFEQMPELFKKTADNEGPEFIDYSFGQPDGQLNHEEDTPDLMSSSSTDPSPKSNTDGENSLSTMSSLSDIRKDDPHDLHLGLWKEFDGGESAYYQPFEW